VGATKGKKERKGGLTHEGTRGANPNEKGQTALPKKAAEKKKGQGEKIHKRVSRKNPRGDWTGEKSSWSAGRQILKKGEKNGGIKEKKKGSSGNKVKKKKKRGGSQRQNSKVLRDWSEWSPAQPEEGEGRATKRSNPLPLANHPRDGPTRIRHGDPFKGGVLTTSPGGGKTKHDNRGGSHLIGVRKEKGGGSRKNTGIHGHG